MQIRAATDSNEMQGIFCNEQDLNQSALSETGYMKPFEALTLDDKEEIISILMEYHCLVKPKACIDQFAEGLQSTGVLHYIRNYGGMIRNQFKFQPLILTTGIYVTRFAKIDHVRAYCIMRNTNLKY